MENKKNLYIVYCIDTEGPLDESLDATFERLNQIFGVSMQPTEENLLLLQTEKINHPNKKQIAKALDKQLLSYNRNWAEIDSMLDKIMTKEYRDQYLDHEGKGLIYNWHCLDHIGYENNPRKRDLGYGKIFEHYSKKIKQDGVDKIHWHFHPIAFNKSAATSATSYDNSMYFLHQIISRRVIEHNWFPVVNRAGFHTIRQDSSNFLEQWIPFDYSNQAEYEESKLDSDLGNGRFGDWRRAPKEWKPYHPDHDDYQIRGNMRRYTTKCLNIGTRLRLLTDLEIENAFQLAFNEGKAILSFTNHDFRDMSIDIEDVFPRILEISKKYSDVEIIHSDAVRAMQDYLYNNNEPNENKIELDFHLDNELNKDDLTTLTINTKKGSVFGPQPYLAFKDKGGVYFHDNFDEIMPQHSWSYSFDNQTKIFSELETIKVAANDKFGNTRILKIK